jgi:hypothetical protein
MSSQAAIDISNIALLRIGHTLITAFDDLSAEAKACALLYPQLRDAILEQHPFRSHIKRTRLARLADVPLPGDNEGLGSQFAMPADYGHMVDTDIPGGLYRLERGAYGGLVLLAPCETVHIVYALAGDAAARYFALFRETLAFRLAADLAMALTGKETLMERHQKRSDGMEQVAALTNEREQGLKTIPTYGRLVQVRGSRGSVWDESHRGGW